MGCKLFGKKENGRDDAILSNVDVNRIQRGLDLLDDGLRLIVEEIIDDCKHHNLPFRVFETGRFLERQVTLKAQGASRTLNSKHLVEVVDNKVIKKSKAVDFVLYYSLDGKMVWSWANQGDDMQQKKDLGLYKMLGEMILSRYDCIKNKSFIDRIVWGGQWATFKDYPHFEID